MKIVEKKLSELKPYANNPRNNDAAVDAVAASIKSFGFKVPLVVTADDEIVAGHTRLRAAEKLGLKTVPCIVADDLTSEQVKAFRLADNKTAELAAWDFEKLDLELSEIDFDMAQFGFEMEESEGLEQSEPVEDEPPEPPEEPVSKLGDVWILGNHRLVCGDSTKKSTFDFMHGKKAALVFTDPPWNVNYGDAKDHPSYRPRKILNDYMPTEEFKNFMRQAFARMSENLQPGAVTYVVMSAQEWGNLMLTLAENDFHWPSTIIWNKDQLVLSRKDYHTKYEPIWYGWDGRAPRLHPLEDRKQCDVWDIPRPKKSDEHPTMKPVELVFRAITNSSNKGDAVLDIFGGSGTTLIAAEQSGRRCFMVELDPKYVDVIIERWQNLTGKEAVLERSGETFNSLK